MKEITDKQSMSSQCFAWCLHAACFFVYYSALVLEKLFAEDNEEYWFY